MKIKQAGAELCQAQYMIRLTLLLASLMVKLLQGCQNSSLGGWGEECHTQEILRLITCQLVFDLPTGTELNPIRPGGGVQSARISFFWRLLFFLVGNMPLNFLTFL